MPEVVIPLTADEAEAVDWLAARRSVTTSQLLRKALADELASVLRVYREWQWDQRRKALERDPTLAATVDAATEAPS